MSERKMRKTFIDIIQSKGFSVNTEFQRLKELFYYRKANYSYSERISLREYINGIFLTIKGRKNATSLDDFDRTYGFDFYTTPQVDDLDTLLVFCEYIMYFVSQVNFPNELKKLREIVVEQIIEIIRTIAYEPIKKDEVISFVPKEPAAIEVAESVDDEDVSYKVLFYNHHSLKGDLEGKREILDKLAHKLEPRKKDLKSVNPDLSNLVFRAFNNLNIRHNNVETTNCNESFTQLSDDEKENLYDCVYRYSLMAFLELENQPLKEKLLNTIAKNKK